MGGVALTVVGVLFVKGVTINTLSLTGIHSGKTAASHLVLSVIHDFKMGRVDAVAHAAKVVTLFLGRWNVLYEHFIHQAVRTLGFAIHLDASVSLSVNTASPQPAGTAFVGDGGVNLNLFKQTSNAAEVFTPWNPSVFAIPSLAANSLGTLFTGGVVPAGLTVSFVEFGARLFSVARTACFERDRIKYGHRCLQLGNVT